MKQLADYYKTKKPRPEIKVINLTFLQPIWQLGSQIL